MPQGRTVLPVRALSTGLDGVVRATRPPQRTLVAEVIPVTTTPAAGPAPRSVAASDRAAVGRRGEDIAARYLDDQGWQVLDRNWRPDHGLRGELDLVALEPVPGRAPALVVVEVKTRTTLGAGPPAASVGADKLARLRVLAAAWAARHPVPHGGLRLDVVSVLLHPDRPADLRHHRGVGAS